eukprot:1328181-Amorphochlora_amoeboformis.AAC.1
MAPASRRVENSAPVGGIEWRAVWTVAVLEASLSIFEYLCGEKCDTFVSILSGQFLSKSFTGDDVTGALIRSYVVRIRSFGLNPCLPRIVGSTAIVAWVVWRLGGTIGISAQDVLER